MQQPPRRHAATWYPEDTWPHHIQKTHGHVIPRRHTAMSYPDICGHAISRRHVTMPYPEATSYPENAWPHRVQMTCDRVLQLSCSMALMPFFLPGLRCSLSLVGVAMDALFRAKLSTVSYSQHLDKLWVSEFTYIAIPSSVSDQG